MSRWQLQGTGDYYARYSAYEKYLRANAKDLGLSQSQVEQQLGRYSAGLQQKLQYEPQNIAVGKDIAKNPAEYVINPNNVTTELKKATERLETLQNGLTPVAEKSEYQKALKNSQLYNSTGRDSVTPPNSVDKLGRKKQTQILKEIEKLSKLAKTDEEIADLESRLKAFRGGNDQKAFSQAIQKQAENLDKQKAVEHKPAEPKTWQKYAETHGTQYKAPEKFGDIEADKKAQEIIDANKNKGARTTILGSPQAETVDDILDDAAKLKTEAEAASKESKGFMNSVKNAMKGKKGKVALAAGAVAALGAGVYALFGSKGEENVEQAAMKAEPQQPEKTQPQKQESKTETPENLNQEKETQVVTNPQNQEEHQAKVNQQEETTPEKALLNVPKTETAAETESESAEGKVADEEYVIVKKGDSFWNLAKEHLIEKHKDESGYKPSNAEILELAMKFMEDNGYKLDENNYYPEPMLHPGVKLNLAM